MIPTVADDPLAQLLKSGIIPGAGAGYFGGGIPSLETSTEKNALPLWQNSSAQEELLKLAGQDGRRDAAFGNDTIKAVVLQSLPGGGVHPSLKERQQRLIDMLYSRWVAHLSCPKNAEVKFAFFREEMSQVSPHLDWHFRVKGTEKYNARRAQSR